MIKTKTLAKQQSFGVVTPEENVDGDEDDDEKKKKQRPYWVIKLGKFMNHWSVTTIMTLVTLFALFGDDIKLAFFTKEVDSTFDNMTFVCLILFSLEITLNAISQVGYFNSFYFWLDVISTLSLITDISWIWVQIVGD